MPRSVASYVGLHFLTMSTNVARFPVNITFTLQGIRFALVKVDNSLCPFTIIPLRV